LPGDILAAPGTGTGRSLSLGFQGSTITNRRWELTPILSVNPPWR
jgi:hypothetical protein